LNNETVIVGLCCLFLAIVFFLFKPQFFILLNRLAKIEFGGTKNLQYIDQDFEPESPTPSSPVLNKEKIAVRIILSIILSYLIYVVPNSLSRVLIEFGNFEYSVGSEKIGTTSYNLALELSNDLNKAMKQCVTDDAQKQYKLAIEHCGNAIEINKNYATAYFYRGNAYLNLKQYDQAIADFTNDIEFIPIATRSYINRSVVYLDQNKLDLAIADFTKSIDINPKESLAYSNRGLTYFQQSQPDLAILDCNKAIELEKKDWSAYFCLGEAFNGQQKYDIAKTNLNKAIELNPNRPEPYYTRGTVYAVERVYDLAISDLSKAIEIDPNMSQSYYARGTIYAAQKNYDLAISDFGKAIEIDPKYVDPYIWRGNAFADTKKFTQAITDYQKELSISPNSYIYCVQGVTYTKMNEFKLAITSLEQGVKLDITSENYWCKSALENARLGILTP